MEENPRTLFEDMKQKLIDDFKLGLSPDDTWKHKPTIVSEEFYSLLQLGDIRSLIFDNNRIKDQDRRLKLYSFLSWLRVAPTGNKVLKGILEMYASLIIRGVPYLEALRQVASNFLYIGYLIGKYEAENSKSVFESTTRKAKRTKKSK